MKRCLTILALIAAVGAAADPLVVGLNQHQDWWSETVIEDSGQAVFRAFTPSFSTGQTLNLERYPGSCATQHLYVLADVQVPVHTSMATEAMGNLRVDAMQLHRVSYTALVVGGSPEAAVVVDASREKALLHEMRKGLWLKLELGPPEHPGAFRDRYSLLGFAAATARTAMLCRAFVDENRRHPASTAPPAPARTPKPAASQTAA